MTPQESRWAEGPDGEWTRTVNGKFLRVTLDPCDPNRPWAWEVFTVHEEWDEEHGLGRAESLEAAMAAAELVALSVERYV